MRPGSIEYDPVLAEEILERLADGDSLASICHDEGMHDERSVSTLGAKPGRLRRSSLRRSRITRACRRRETRASASTLKFYTGTSVATVLSPEQSKAAEHP
jgi:hypothetical protein